MPKVTVGMFVGQTTGMFPSSDDPVDPIAAAIKADAVSAWSHDEAGTLIDLIGANDLVKSGLIASEAGKIGNCSRSTSGTASVTAAAMSPADSSFTVAAWINVNTDGFSGVMGSGEGGDGWAVRIGFSTNINLLFLKGGIDGQTNTAGNSFVAGTWFMLVIGYDHENLQRFYSFNGAAKTTAAHITGVGASGSAFRFGRGYNQDAIDTSVDESIFVARVLTDEEIAWLYNSGAGRAMSTIASA
jgi:hypothetical protein